MRVRTISLLAVFVSGLAVGCGGAFVPIDSTGGDGGGGDSGVQDGGGPADAGGGDAVTHDAPTGQDAPAPWSPACPDAPPKPGDACTQQTVQCEYGTATWNVACDTTFQCENAVWTTIKPSYEACTPEPGPNPAACPASYSAVPTGTACHNNITCTYPEAVCACDYGFGGPPPDFDGGIAGSWGCVPEPGCPMPRPRLGSACSIEGTFCTYETCTYGQTCINGMWQSQPMACAGGATP